MRKIAALALLSIASLGLALWAAAQDRSGNAGDASPPATAAPNVAGRETVKVSNSPAKNPARPHTDLPLRLEGERRFHANCGRCHVAPQKYSPRVMATVVRHMRVRASVTDEDMRYILAYISQ
jgi:cytochrome c5